MNQKNQEVIDKSEIFLALITTNYYDDMEALECFLYAKNKKKPMIILIQEGTEEKIPDLFENCRILNKIYFSDPSDMSNKLIEIMKKYKGEL